MALEPMTLTTHPSLHNNVCPFLDFLVQERDNSLKGANLQNRTGDAVIQTLDLKLWQCVICA